MRQVAVCVVAAAVLVAVGDANAAPKGNVKAPAGVAVDWTGFYAGVHGGYANGDWDGQLRSTAGSPILPLSPADIYRGHQTLDADGWLGGLQFGYNKQLGKVVLGVEADVSWTGLDGKETNRQTFFGANPGESISYDKTHKPELDYFGTLRGRVGYDFGGILPFVTGGVALGRARETLNVDVNSVGFVWARGLETNEASGRAEEDHIGWTAGAGVEGKVGYGWSLKAEWLHVDLGSADYLFVGQHNIGPNAGQSFATDAFPADLEFNVYRIGLNYQFTAE